VLRDSAGSWAAPKGKAASGGKKRTKYAKHNSMTYLLTTASQLLPII
jgi:hypothetical protein